MYSSVVDIMNAHFMLNGEYITAKKKEKGNR